VQVDADEMRSGANQSYGAAWLATEGTEQLSRAPVSTGIFGSFAAAESFQAAVNEAHSNHIQRLRDHESRALKPLLRPQWSQVSQRERSANGSEVKSAPLSTGDQLPTSTTDFPWSTVLFVARLVLILVTLAGIGRAESRRSKRRIYWSGWMSATLCAAISLLPLGPRTTAITFVGFAFCIVFWAYLTTPYLKIGERIFALTMADSRPDPDPDTGGGLPKLTPPPDSYPGPVTAATAWWILAILTVTAAVGVYLRGWMWPTAAVTAVLVVLGTVSVIDDASRRLPAVRGTGSPRP